MIYFSLALLVAAAFVYAQMPAPSLEQYQIGELQKFQKRVEDQHWWLMVLLVSNLAVLVFNLLKDRWRR